MDKEAGALASLETDCYPRYPVRDWIQPIDCNVVAILCCGESPTCYVLLFPVLETPDRNQSPD